MQQKCLNCTESGDKSQDKTDDESQDDTDRSKSPETQSKSATNVPLVALTSTPIPSTSKAESVCTDEPSMPLPSDTPIINPGTSGSNTSIPHSSPQKGTTTSVDIDSSCKDNTSSRAPASYSQIPPVANNTFVAHDSSSLQQQHIYTMIVVSIHVITFLNGLFANPLHNSSMSSNTGRVSNGVLMKCSSHLNQLPKLAGYLGIPDSCLQQIQSDFTDPDIQGYRLLKKWKELYPNSSLADLIEVFQYLGLNEAVKVLEEN
uniref:Death domain-containing protein n=2 Tax=Amphimedon queenslandica TaxID=400682 RepID=A0A1X7THK9_AMPQE